MSVVERSRPSHDKLEGRESKISVIQLRQLRTLNQLIAWVLERGLKFDVSIKIIRDKQGGKEAQHIRWTLEAEDGQIKAGIPPIMQWGQRIRMMW